MKRNTIILFVLLLSLQIVACKKGTDANYTNTLQLPAGTTPVIQAHNQFALNVFKAQLQTDSVNYNTLISPLSIYLSLSMAYNGANATTKDSMAKALQLSGIDINTVNEVCKALTEQLSKEDNQVQTSIANSVWYTNTFPAPLPTFLSTVSNDYHAKCSSLNFNDPSSVSVINNWVSANTNGKIPTIIDAIKKEDIMFLINAIYFKGMWQYGFPVANTYNDQFSTGQTTTVQTAFMKTQINTSICATDQFTMAELPYGTGKGFAMYLLVPRNTTQGIRNFVNTLDLAAISNAVIATDTKPSIPLTLTMPKWEYSYSIKDLSGPLESLGMGLAFSDYADFSNMYNVPEPIKISKVIHKAYIKTDESGSEAAAATATVASTTSAISPSVLKVDHPFAYAIAEKQSGAILFLGTIGDPSRH